MMLQIKSGLEINKNPKYKYILVTCPNCGKERWVIITRENKPGVCLCKSCAPKSSSHPSWNKGLTKETDERVARIANARLGGHVSEETRKKMRAAMLQLSNETRVKMSVSAKTRQERKYSIKNPDEVIRLYLDSELSIYQICKLLGHSSERVKCLLLGNSIELRPKGEEISRALRRVWDNYPEDKRNFLINRFIESGKRAAKQPNISEQILWGIIAGAIPGEYTYTGWQVLDQTVTIGGLRPDFFNVNSKKKVIEFFGSRFHPVELSREQTEKVRKDKYREFGFDCLILWDSDLGNYIETATKVIHFNQR